MSRNRIYSHLLIMLILATVICVGLPGCGSSITAPSTATITITPEDVSYSGLAADTVADFKVLVQYTDGTPMPHAKVTITGGFAVPRSSARYQFYYYPLGPNRPGGNTAVDSGFEAQTNEFGVYEFSALVYAGGQFTDTIYVSSGAVIASAGLALTTQ